MSDVRLALVIEAQRLKIERLEARCARLARTNAQLHSRVTKLTQSRDRWKTRATYYRPYVNRLRVRVQDTHRSREMWKVRALRK